MLALTTIVIYDHSFIVLANGVTIVNYDRKGFIEQATAMTNTLTYYRVRSFLVHVLIFKYQNTSLTENSNCFSQFISIQVIKEKNVSNICR